MIGSQLVGQEDFGNEASVVPKLTRLQQNLPPVPAKCPSRQPAANPPGTFRIGTPPMPDCASNQCCSVVFVIIFPCSPTEIAARPSG